MELNINVKTSVQICCLCCWACLTCFCCTCLMLCFTGNMQGCLKMRPKSDRAFFVGETLIEGAIVSGHLDRTCPTLTVNSMRFAVGGETAFPYNWCASGFSSTGWVDGAGPTTAFLATFDRHCSRVLKECPYEFRRTNSQESSLRPMDPNVLCDWKFFT